MAWARDVVARVPDKAAVEEKHDDVASQATRKNKQAASASFCASLITTTLVDDGSRFVAATHQLLQFVPPYSPST
jgi:hypothetical protein